jgi:hypothetical protein
MSTELRRRKSRLFIVIANLVLVTLGMSCTCNSARAADTTVTHVVANAWQSTDFHDQNNPGCSVGGSAVVPGGRLIMGASKTRPDPMSLVLRKIGWTIPANTAVQIQATFSDGFAMQLAGTGKGQVIEINIAADQLREWVHELTASSTMQVAFGGGEPNWSFDLTGATKVVNAMGDCFHAHQISGVAAPFDGLTVATPQPLSPQPFGGLPPPQPAAGYPTAANPPPSPPAEQYQSSVSQRQQDAISPGPVPPGESVIMRWSGSDRMQTRPFHAEGPWELQWTSSKGYFSATLHRTSDPDGSGKLLANGTQGGSSSFYHPTGGDFYITFTGSQPWSAVAVAIPLPEEAPTAQAAPVVPDQSMPTTAIPSQAPGLARAQRVEGEPSGAPVIPSGEKGLVEAVEAARRQYRDGENDMAKGAARPMRAQQICRAVTSAAITNWTGTIDDLTTNGEGKGVISIQIAQEIYLKTFNNSLSDVMDHTLIDPASSLFQAASGLHKGQSVQFSAVLIPNATDCFEEASLTMDGSITEPEFIMRLTAIQGIP